MLLRRNVKEPHLQSLPHYGQVCHRCQSSEASSICCFVGTSKNPISRASPTMAKCVTAVKAQK